MSNEKSFSIVKDNHGGESSDLLAAAAALGPEDRVLNALKDKLQNLARKQRDFLQTLSPEIHKRVGVLKDIQVEHDGLETKFLEEKAALETKYEKLYQPLYVKRYEIVNGVVEVKEEQAETVAKQENKDKALEEEGVPEFWMTAMKANEIIANEIMDRDERALKFLKDIRCCRLNNSTGFKLEFHFDPNPYFENSVLSKTYHLIDDDGPVLEKVIGTEIAWFPGKCLTHKVVKKKPRKGSKNTNNKTVTKTEKCESFFNFFKPPMIPDIDDDDDDDFDADMAEELQNLMDQDYDIAVTIRDKLIPHAVSWFTGEALDDDYDEEDGVNDEKDKK